MRLRRLLDRFSGTEEIFTRIYRRNVWGGKDGEPCSGGGSTDASPVDGYVAMFREHSERFGFAGMRVVDLGCGDMRVGEKLLPFCGTYTGADVVAFLVEAHTQRFGSERIHFLHLDAVRDELPDGDVCLIRQVFQHMSNRQIARVLEKLGKYRYVYITEHVPRDGSGAIPNKDKPTGAGIRLERGSGVDVSAPPFDVPSRLVEVVLDITLPADGGAVDPGVIRTALYQPAGGME